MNYKHSEEYKRYQRDCEENRALKKELLDGFINNLNTLDKDFLYVENEAGRIVSTCRECAAVGYQQIATDLFVNTKNETFCRSSILSFFKEKLRTHKHEKQQDWFSDFWQRYYRVKKTIMKLECYIDEVFAPNSIIKVNAYGLELLTPEKQILSDIKFHLKLAKGRLVVLEAQSVSYLDGNYDPDSNGWLI